MYNKIINISKNIFDYSLIKEAAFIAAMKKIKGFSALDWIAPSNNNEGFIDILIQINKNNGIIRDKLIEIHLDLNKGETISEKIQKKDLFISNQEIIIVKVIHKNTLQIVADTINNLNLRHNNLATNQEYDKYIYNYRLIFIPKKQIIYLAEFAISEKFRNKGFASILHKNPFKLMIKAGFKDFSLYVIVASFVTAKWLCQHLGADLFFNNNNLLRYRKEFYQIGILNSEKIYLSQPSTASERKNMLNENRILRKFIKRQMDNNTEWNKNSIPYRHNNNYLAYILYSLMEYAKRNNLNPLELYKFKFHCFFSLKNAFVKKYVS